MAYIIYQGEKEHNMTKSDSIFVKCSCGGCSVIEISDPDDDGEFDFSMWLSHPGNTPMSQNERKRWCKDVMKTGDPWSDHTIVSMDNAKKIVQFLTEKINQYDKKNKSLGK